MIIREVYSQYFNDFGYLLNPKCLCSCVGRTEIEGAVLRNSAELGNYKMPVKLRET